MPDSPIEATAARIAAERAVYSAKAADYDAALERLRAAQDRERKALRAAYSVVT